MNTDPIADMLCRVSNANHKFHERVDIPASNFKKEIAHVLKEEGYIADYKLISDRKQGTLRLFLKYAPNKTRIIQGIKRVSRPGLRKYADHNKMPKIRGGLGMAIVSTSKGVMSDEQSRKQKVGGEIVARVW